METHLQNSNTQRGGISLRDLDTDSLPWGTENLKSHALKCIQTIREKTIYRTKAPPFGGGTVGTHSGSQIWQIPCFALLPHTEIHANFRLIRWLPRPHPYPDASAREFIGIWATVAQNAQSQLPSSNHRELTLRTPLH